MIAKLFKEKMINHLYRLVFCALILGYPVLAEAESNLTLSASMSQILSNRYSGYQYDSTRSITQEQLQEILEAGRLAPSSYNEQPWNFIVCDRTRDPKAFKKALNTLVEFNQEWAKHASILIICIAANKSCHSDGLNRWGQYDTGAAAFSMMLKATSIGLMAHQMGGFDEKKIRYEFLIPESYEPMSVMAIGYQSSKEIQSDRKHKPLSENFFIGSWGNKFGQMN